MTDLRSVSGWDGESSTVGRRGNGCVHGGGLGDFGGSGGGGGACLPWLVLFLFSDISRLMSIELSS